MRAERHEVILEVMGSNIYGQDSITFIGIQLDEFAAAILTSSSNAATAVRKSLCQPVSTRTQRLRTVRPTASGPPPPYTNTLSFALVLLGAPELPLALFALAFGVIRSHRCTLASAAEQHLPLIQAYRAQRWDAPRDEVLVLQLVAIEFSFGRQRF